MVYAARYSSAIGIGLFLLLLFSACTTAAQPTPTATSEPSPTATAVAIPTSTPEPSATPSPSPTATATAIPTPTSTPVSVTDILERSFTTLEAVDSFHFDLDLKMTIKGDGFALMVPFRLVGDFAQPNMMQAQMNLDAFGFYVNSQVIGIDGTTYVKDTETNEWRLATEDDLDILFDPTDFVPSDDAYLIEEFTDLRYLWDEEIDGVMTMRISTKIPAKNLGSDFEGAGTTLRAEWWIGKEDFLMRQMRLSGVIPVDGDTGEDSGLISGIPLANAEVDVTFKLSAFDEPVVIEAPELAPLAETDATGGVPPITAE